MKEAQSLVGQGFCEVTPAMWAKMCEHVKVEDAFWDKDGLTLTGRREIMRIFK